MEVQERHNGQLDSQNFPFSTLPPNSRELLLTAFLETYGENQANNTKMRVNRNIEEFEKL